MLPEEVDIPDFSKESRAFTFFKKVGLVTDPTSIIFQLDKDWDFNIERIHAEYPSVNAGIAGIYAKPLLIQVSTNASSYQLQPEPFDISFICTPGTGGVLVDTTNPADPFSASTLDRAKLLNVLCYANGTIRVDVGNVTQLNSPTNPALNLPSFFEIMIIGRYFPVMYEPYFDTDYAGVA
jgi:hypothetical protein